jgi:hypothetical protein
VEALVGGGGEDGYFPNGLQPQNDQLPISYSPVTGPEMHGPDNQQLFQTGAYPARDDGPQYSWDQGLGRSPGQTWPHMPHREQYAFDKEQAVGFGTMEDGSADLPADSNANPLLGKAERAGWAMMGPAIAGEYYAQEVHQHQWYPEPISVENAPAIPLVGVAEVPGW